MNTDIRNYLDPNVLSSISNLELIARLVVEGFITGLHKSPFHGFSVEFSQHRPYMQGDSLRFIDWKIFARSDRYYVKQFEEETNLRCQLLFDISKSMTFKSHSISKFQYGAMLTSSLAYLMLKQRDATGLILFDDAIKKNIPPRSVPGYIRDIIAAIHNAQPGNDTNITNVLHLIAEKMRRRGLVIIISDFLDDASEIINGIKHLRHNQHEVIVFHIVDPQEENFDFKGEYIFEDLETKAQIKTYPKYIQEEYKKMYAEHFKYLQTKIKENSIDYIKIKTSEPLDIALSEYLLKRYKLF